MFTTHTLIRILKYILPGIVMILFYLAATNMYKSVVQRGYDSRNEEVTALIGSVETLTAANKVFKTNETTFRDKIAQLEADKDSLNSKIGAMETEKLNALKNQKATFEATQAVTNKAMRDLAAIKQPKDIDFAAIFKEMKGLDYVYDTKTDSCRIINGGTLLHNAAKGK